MDYEIKGTVMPHLVIRLRQGEAVFTESGGMAWMDDGIEMKTSGRGGLGGMLGRALAGESMFLTTYTCEAPEALISFTVETPGGIVALDLQAGQTVIAQKDAFMVADDSVTLAMHFQRKLGAGLFGGEGFILQKLTGPGRAFLEIGGEVQERLLSPGQILKVDPGHIAAMDPEVDFDIQMVKGVGNMLLGGEGLFLARLRGPGRVWLQTMPPSSLANALIPFLPKRN